MNAKFIELSDKTVYLARLEPKTASEDPLTDKEKVILDLHGQIEKLTTSIIIDSLPTMLDLFEKARYHTDVICNLQNFEDADSILLYQGKYVDGYIKAIKDFVNDKYDPDSIGK